MRPNQEKVRSTIQRRLITSKPTACVRVAPDHLEAQRVVGGRGLVGLLRVVAAVGEHALEPGKALADLVQQQGRAVAVLHPGGVDDEADRQAKRVDKGVDLAAFHLLARVVSHCVGWVGGWLDRPFPGATPPFSADLIDCPKRRSPKLQRPLDRNARHSRSPYHGSSWIQRCAWTVTVMLRDRTGSTSSGPTLKKVLDRRHLGALAQNSASRPHIPFDCRREQSKRVERERSAA